MAMKVKTKDLLTTMAHKRHPQTCPPHTTQVGHRHTKPHLPSCHETQTEVTYWPTSQVFSPYTLQQESLQWAIMWWTDGREIEGEHFRMIKRNETGDSKVEGDNLLWLAITNSITWGLCEVLPTTATEGHVWAHCYANAGVVVDDHSTYYH